MTSLGPTILMLKCNDPGKTNFTLYLASLPVLKFHDSTGYAEPEFQVFQSHLPIYVVIFYPFGLTNFDSVPIIIMK